MTAPPGRPSGELRQFRRLPLARRSSLVGTSGELPRRARAQLVAGYPREQPRPPSPTSCAHRWQRSASTARCSSSAPSSGSIGAI